MASIINICGICSLRQITKTSFHWCPECEEAICDECKEHHKLLKATRSHKPIAISSYKSPPSVITDIHHSCIYHNEQYQQYCVEHALPICFKCINEHRKCNVTTLENVTVNVKNSGQFLDLESRLEDLLLNIDIMKKDRKANVTGIENLKTRQVAEIKKKRLELNKHLDNLERQFIKDIEEKVCKCKEGIQKVVSSIKEKETVIHHCQVNFQSIKKYASDLQIFLAMREIELKVDENEKYLHCLSQSKSFEQLDIVCKNDTGVQSIFKSLKLFGIIEIKTRTKTIDFIRAKDKQAQFQVAGAKKTINNMKLNMQKKIPTYGEEVRGGCMSKEGDALFTDYFNKKSLNVIKSDDTLRYIMPLDPSYGYDITFIDEKTVAITSGHLSMKTGIDIINIKNRSKLNFIRLPDRTYGITCDHGFIFVCVSECGIYKVNTLDYTTSRVISCSLPAYSYVSVSTEKIYYTDYKDASVICCDHNGSRIWVFKDDSVLKIPRGIAVDNDGSVFVIGHGSSNVVIISNDGKSHKEILNKEDGLREPSAIFFDKQKRELLVANDKQTAFLYNIT